MEVSGFVKIERTPEYVKAIKDAQTIAAKTTRFEAKRIRLRLFVLGFMDHPIVTFR